MASGDVHNVSQTSVQDIARKVVANVLIQTVSQMEIMDVLGQAQTAIQRRVQTIAQEQFDDLNLGITIKQTDTAEAVRITTARVPAPLQEVFNSIGTARQEGRQLIHEAEENYNRIVDQAKAEALKILNEARTYKRTTIKQAQGDAKRYTKLIKEYKDKGEAIRDRFRYEKLAEVAPFLKTPTIYAIPSTNGKQKLVIIIPDKPK